MSADQWLENGFIDMTNEIFCIEEPIQSHSWHIKKTTCGSPCSKGLKISATRLCLLIVPSLAAMQFHASKLSNPDFLIFFNKRKTTKFNRIEWKEL